MAKILVVDDEKPIADMIQVGLEREHFDVEAVYDGCTGLNLAVSGAYSLLILDLMLPRMDGWSVCETLRRRKNRVPILMLTARDSLDDRIRGLDIGADDYLIKPFQFGELLARVRALLRRDKIHKARVLSIADLEIDTGLRRVTREGRAIHLTPREYALLEALAVREGTVLSREAILEQVWMEEDCYSNEVDVYIGHLRRKIDAGRAVKLIQTVHRAGYMLCGLESEALGNGTRGSSPQTVS